MGQGRDATVWLELSFASEARKNEARIDFTAQSRVLSFEPWVECRGAMAHQASCFLLLSLLLTGIRALLLFCPDVRSLGSGAVPLWSAPPASGI